MLTKHINAVQVTAPYTSEESVRLYAKDWNMVTINGAPLEKPLEADSPRVRNLLWFRSMRQALDLPYVEASVLAALLVQGVFDWFPQCYDSYEQHGITVNLADFKPKNIDIRKENGAIKINVTATVRAGAETLPLEYELSYETRAKSASRMDLVITPGPVSLKGASTALIDSLNTRVSPPPPSPESDDMIQSWKQAVRKFLGSIKNPALAAKMCKKLGLSHDSRMSPLAAGWYLDKVNGESNYLDFLKSVYHHLIQVRSDLDTEAFTTLYKHAFNLSKQLSPVYKAQRADSRGKAKAIILEAIKTTLSAADLEELLKDLHDAVNTSAAFRKLLVDARSTIKFAPNNAIIGKKLTHCSGTYSEIMAAFKQRSDYLAARDPHEHSKTDLRMLSFYQRRRALVDKGVLLSAAAFSTAGGTIALGGSILLSASAAKLILAGTIITALGAGTAGIGLAVIGGVVVASALAYMAYRLYKHSQKRVDTVETPITPSLNKHVDSNLFNSTPRTATLLGLLDAPTDQRMMLTAPAA